ncbi:hypothetical protein [Maribacter sp. 2304DJ31-5]|uniref:hypothetical protein n=1 Tax=Maribacter sp. 2304DJ31-5 TaxID=3386273 RepID=UPI0039BC8290
MRTILFLGCLFMFFSGCKKENPKPPEAARLIFPERNSECTTGEPLNATTTQVEFRWEAADNTETYQLRVTNINTGVAQTITTSSTSARLPIERGEPFSWLVLSKNGQVDRTVSSETWSFYNQGSRTTFAPFPADIISPKMSENIFKDMNNEVTLSWTASDLDNDITEYEVYFSLETPPTSLENTLSNGNTSLKVSVSSNTVYYWNIVVKDREGNATNSGIYSFKVL